jgi:hypothetical protein
MLAIALPRCKPPLDMQLSFTYYVIVYEGSTTTLEGFSAMSDQEFMPEPQSQGQQFAENDDIDTYYAEQAYVQQAQANSKVTPKEEPPSSYDEPMTGNTYSNDYQHGYSDQAHTTATNQQRKSGKTTTGSNSQQYYYHPDGDAYENQYRPHYAQNQQYQQWNVPAWARPQPHKRSAMSFFWLIILGLIFIGPLMHLLGILFAVIGILFLVVFVPLMLFLVIGLPLIIMRALSGPFMGGGMRRNSFWMGYRPRRRGIWW